MRRNGELTLSRVVKSNAFNFRSNKRSVMLDVLRSFFFSLFSCSPRWIAGVQATTDRALIEKRGKIIKNKVGTRTRGAKMNDGSPSFRDCLHLADSAQKAT